MSQTTQRGRYRWPLRLAALAAAGVAMFLWAAQKGQQAFLAVENRSGQPIALLQVTMGGQTRTFRDVAVGAEVTAPLSGAGDDRFAVEGRLADGTVIRGRGVAREPTRIIILPGGQVQIRPDKGGRT